MCVLLELARLYGVAVAVNRDAADDVLLKAFRRVALKAHPDKGGRAPLFENQNVGRAEQKV